MKQHPNSWTHGLTGLALSALALTAAFADDGGMAGSAKSADLDEGAPLEAFMTADEIFLEFIAQPEGISPAAEVQEDAVNQLPQDPYALPVDGADLPMDPGQLLTAKFPEHLHRYFDIILYVNKAAEGPYAQEMLVYKKNEADEFPLTYRWLTSTGREMYEKYFTTTPEGMYKLDHQRFFEKRNSRLWGNVAMNWAMFFDLDYRNRKSGLAIHAANSKTVKQLGRRASGGCIRLHPDHAEKLFKMIQADHIGYVPEFPFDEARGSTARDGRISYIADPLDPNNTVPEMVPGAKVLLIVDDLGSALAMR